jgi:hypothetical protein
MAGYRLRRIAGRSADDNALSSRIPNEIPDCFLADRLGGGDPDVLVRILIAVAESIESEFF